MSAENQPFVDEKALLNVEREQLQRQRARSFNVYSLEYLHFFFLTAAPSKRYKTHIVHPYSSIRVEHQKDISENSDLGGNCRGPGSWHPFQ